VHKDKIMKNFSLLLFFVLLSSRLFSQYSEEDLNKIIKESSTSKLVKLNTEMLLNKVYRQAALVGEELVRKAPENSNFNYRLGYAYLYYHLTLKSRFPF
jgi:hypothetical protein